MHFFSLMAIGTGIRKLDASQMEISSQPIITRIPHSPMIKGRSFFIEDALILSKDCHAHNNIFSVM
jgi:hypothetical protein